MTLTRVKPCLLHTSRHSLRSFELKQSILNLIPFIRNKFEALIYNYFFFTMLAVHPAQLSSPQNQTQELEQEPSLSEVDISQPKQQTRRKLLTPLNIVIVLAVLAVVGAGTYYFLDLGSEKGITNQINESHGKIINYADSSKKEGSSAGSSSSKSSNSNNKPNPRSAPASRDTISSNKALTSAGSPGDDEDKNNDKDSSKKKSSTDVSSNEGESEESEEQQGEQEDNTESFYWVDTKPKGTPTNSMVGDAREP